MVVCVRVLVTRVLFEALAALFAALPESLEPERRAEDEVVVFAAAALLLAL